MRTCPDNGNKDGEGPGDYEEKLKEVGAPCMEKIQLRGHLIAIFRYLVDT